MATKARKLNGIRKPRAAAKWEADKYYYDDELEGLWLDVFPLFFKFIEGERYGEPFELVPFWMDIFLRFFCWKDKKTDRRRYRTLFIFIPRKNAKTMTLAAIGLALLMIMRLHRGQVFILASDEEQAGIMFKMQVAMIEASPDLQEIFYAGADYIEHVETSAQIRCLTNSQTGKTGLKPDLTIIDEYQEQKSKKLGMVMKTGSVANKEPIFAMIGTMGKHDETEKAPWIDELEKARKILKDPSIDPTYLPVIFECTADDDPSDPELWEAVNPGYGVTIDPLSFQALWEESKDDPALRQDFCQYNLNMPVTVSSEFIDLKAWKELAQPFSLDKFAGQKVYAGLDIGETDDMTALTLMYAEWQEIEFRVSETETQKVMQPLVRILPFYFSPTSAILKSEKKPFSYVPYVNQGLITECGSHAIQWTDLRKKIQNILKEVRLQEMGYDPYRAGEMTEYLSKNRVTMVKVTQSFQVLDFATRRFRDLVNEGDILHNDHPVLLWNLKNARVVSNKHKNIMLSKLHAAGKIDGIAAGINAIRVWMDAPPPAPKQEIFSLG